MLRLRFNSSNNNNKFLNTITCTRPAHVSTSTYTHTTIRTENAIQYRMPHLSLQRDLVVRISLSLYPPSLSLFLFVSFLYIFFRNCETFFLSLPPPSLTLFLLFFLFSRSSIPVFFRLFHSRPPNFLPPPVLYCCYVRRKCAVFVLSSGEERRKKIVEYNKKEKVNRNDLLKRFWTWLRK